MIIHILRHGTTAWNSMFRIQGASDIPLDALGESMARATGASLPSSVDVLGKFRSFGRPTFQESLHRLPNRSQVP